MKAGDLFIYKHDNEDASKHKAYQNDIRYDGYTFKYIDDSTAYSLYAEPITNKDVLMPQIQLLRSGCYPIEDNISTYFNTSNQLIWDFN